MLEVPLNVIRKDNKWKYIKIRNELQLFTNNMTVSTWLMQKLINIKYIKESIEKATRTITAKFINITGYKAVLVRILQSKGTNRIKKKI